MAENEDLVINLVARLDQFESNMKSALDQVSGFGTASVVKGTLISDSIKKIANVVSDFAVGSVKAYADQEAGLRRLTLLVGEKAAASYSELASQIQKTTSFSDDAVVSLQSQFAAFGVLPGSIKEATMAAVDYAAATGKSLPEAGNILTQALSGQGRELKKYGLILEEGATRSENLRRATEFMEKKFGGAAETMKTSVIGTFDNFKNRIDDIREAIGERLVEALIKFQPVIERSVSFLEKLVGADRLGLTETQKKIAALKDELAQFEARNTVMGAVIQGTSQMTEADEARRAEINKQIIALTQQAKSEKDATKEVKEHKGATEEDTDAGRARIVMLQRQLTTEAQVQGRITEITELETRSRIEKARNAFEANASFSQALSVRIIEDTRSWGSAIADMTMNVRDAFASGMADMILDGAKFKDVMENIGRSVLRFFIEEIIKRMVASWITGIATMNAASASLSVSGAAGAGAGGAGGVGAAGMGGAGYAGLGFAAGVAILNSPGDRGASRIFSSFKKKFSGGVIKEPSIITSVRTGEQAFAAERGPEALVSFEDDLGITPLEARRRLSGGGQGSGGSDAGGGVHFHINGNFIEGDQAKWQRMLRDMVIPEIRRYASVSPKGNFIRRRGKA